MRRAIEPERGATAGAEAGTIRPVDHAARVQLAEDYDRWHASAAQRDAGILPALRDRATRRFMRRALDSMEVHAGTALLDVGCGKGAMLSAARRRGAMVSGLDISSEAISASRRLLPESDLRVGVAENLPWPDASFDAVSCLGSLEHFLDPPRAVREMARVMRPTGRAYVFLPNSYFLGHVYLVMRTGQPPDEGGQGFSERFGTRRQWETMLVDNGLYVQRTLPENTVWASPKVGAWTQVLYNLVLKPMLPRNLSYGFGFVCTRARRGNGHP